MVCRYFLFLVMGLHFLVSAKDQQVSLENFWVRAVPKVSEVTAGFGLIKNKTNKDIKLIAVKGEISEFVELHTHRKVKGVMKMRKVPFIKVGKKGEQALAPKSYHIMFIGMKKSLKLGQKVHLEFIFDNGLHIKKLVPVEKF